MLHLFDEPPLRRFRLTAQRHAAHRRGEGVTCALGLALTLFSTAACSPQLQQNTEANLPAPLVITTSVVVADTTEPAPVFPPTLDANAAAADLAQAIYGERLIAYISIPALDLLAPVTPVGWESDDLVRGTPQWDSPGAAVGWALSSALPGDDANIILYGHNNIESSIFRDLSELTAGDVITLQTGEEDWVYVVSEVVILPAVTQEESQAIVDTYLLPGRAPRLTLLSCYPPEGNTQRVVVTAYPSSLP